MGMCCLYVNEIAVCAVVLEGSHGLPQFFGHLCYAVTCISKQFANTLLISIDLHFCSFGRGFYLKRRTDVGKIVNYK